MVIFSLSNLTDSIGELILVLFIFIGFITTLIYLIIKLIPNDKLNNTLFLKIKLDKNGGFISNDNNEHLLGKYGSTITVLRPVGKIKISENIYNATSEDKFIDKDAQILIVKIDGANIIVREV